MRALFYVEPLIMHSRPFHYWSLLRQHADMAHMLRGQGWEVRVVVNEALAVRALAPRGSGTHYARVGHGLPPEEVVVLEQEPIRRLFQVPNAAIVEGLHRGRWDRPRLEAFARIVRDALGDFVPDVMVALAPADHLGVAFPDALLLYCETGVCSRKPYTSVFFLDPAGMWGRSIPAVHAEALLERRPPERERALLERFRARFGEYFRIVSPFGPLEDELRGKYRQIGLLPLQFGGEPGFDCNAPFTSQGEYLFHVLEQLPVDVALIVVEHATAHWVGDIIDEETREHVAARYPNVRFIDYRATPNAGQVLMAHVDFVISVSTSLGLQALVHGKPLVSVGSSHLRPFATVQGMERFPAVVPPPDPRLDAAISWMIRHYFAPLELLKQPEWMCAFLARSLERMRAGRLGLEFFDPICSDDELEATLFRNLDEIQLVPMRGRVANGDFSAWSAHTRPDGWELLDFGGGRVSARQGEQCVTVRRSVAGTGPSLLLQRVPDAASCAGAMARLRFRARSDEPTTLVTYLYVQTDDDRPNEGSPAQVLVLGPEWNEHENVALVPALGQRTPGPDSHVEVVFALPPESGVTSFQLAEVSLEPVFGSPSRA